MLTKRPYQKPALTVQEQIKQLKDRGMIFQDEIRAAEILSRVSYSRLRPYWYPFEADKTTHNFQQNTSFEVVWSLYEFDRALRLLILEALERFEVALRTQWAHQMGLNNGPFGYLEPIHYHDSKRFQNDYQRLRDEWAHTNKADDPVFLHFENTYQEVLPPVWLACEVMSLGNLGKWFYNLADKTVSKDIAALFSLPDRYLKNATRHLVSVRNYAAHHARLWDRAFTVYQLPRLRKNPRNLRQSLDTGSQNQKIYPTLTLLLYLMQQLDPHHDWPTRFITLLNHNTTYLHRMGFPPDYAERPIWKAV